MRRLFGSVVRGWYQRSGDPRRGQPPTIYFVRFACGCERVPGARTTPCHRHRAALEAIA